MVSASMAFFAILGGTVVGALSSNGSLATTSGSEPVTPISMVLDLLHDMLNKSTAAKEDEAVKYAVFAQWCGDTERVKGDEIATGATSIESTEADIEKAEAEIKRLTFSIAEHEEDYARWTRDQKSATDVRDKEQVDFEATSRDYSESIDALSRAIDVLKTQDLNWAQPALLQVQRAPSIPQGAKSAIATFLELSGDAAGQSLASPEAYAYEFNSGGIVEMLEKLLVEFKDQLTELEQEELTAKHEFDQVLQKMTDDKALWKSEIERMTALKADTSKAKASSEQSLAKLQAEKAEDETYLSNLQTLCSQKKADFESRESLRADEIKVMEEAIHILSSDMVAGSGEKHLPALLQGNEKASLGQLRGDRNGTVIQRQIAAFLAGRGKRTGSQVLSQLAAQVVANPFGDVKKMIQELIWKLQAEGTKETENHGWCQAELATNEHTRTSKSEDAERLSVQADELTGNIAEITQELADLTAAIAELEKAMADATEERTASKATNLETIQEAKDAQAAVSKAIIIVKDYYANSATATSFVEQTPIEDAPETFDKPYKGMLPEGGNVVDFMQVILTDFTRLEAETTAAEAREAELYDSFMHESNMDKSLKEGSVEYLTGKKLDQKQTLSSTEDELKAVQDQLAKAEAYYEKLKPVCVDSGITYEERVKRREDEIQSLEEALTILTSANENLSL